MPEIRFPDGIKPSPEAIVRPGRDLLAMATDYSSDDLSFRFADRVKYNKTLHNKLGLQEIRTEFREGRMIPESEKDKSVADMQFDGKIDGAYLDTLKALKEAGMEHPTLVLFTPSEWQKALEKTDLPKFVEMWDKYTNHVLDLCEQAGVTPKYLQVMNEVNFAAQTNMGVDEIVTLIQHTHDTIAARGPRFAETKTMTTFYSGTIREQIENAQVAMRRGAQKIPFVGGRAADLVDMAAGRIGASIDKTIVGKLAGPYVRWETFVQDLIAKCGDNLQAVGFDFYPGSYDKPAISLRKQGDLSKSVPYSSYGDVAPYRWLAEQKLYGFLKDKDIIISETGVFSPSESSRQQKFGYMRMVQALDHLLAGYERQGAKASDIFKGIMFFQVGEHPGVDTKAPMSLDFRPWTLLRKQKNGDFVATQAAQTLKYLIDTRISGR